MKNLFVVFALLFVMVSCSSSKNENAEKPTVNNHVFLFFDKTASVDVNNAFVKNKYISALTKIINSEIQNEGDVLEIYYIHENTAKAKCLEMVSRSKKPSTDGMNATDLEAAKTSYDLMLTKERRLMLAKAVNKLMESNTNSSNKETNISASVPVLAKAVEEGKKVSAYYFSDMIESVNGGRDFHKVAPISLFEAETWASADAEKSKMYSLANAKITMILPFDPMSNSKTNNPNVSDYWKKYFDILGAASVEEQ